MATDESRKPTHHPSVEHLLKFFDWRHLPPSLQLVSEPFCTLAHTIANDLPNNPEKTTALRKLLEAKDCAVRSVV